MERPPRDMKRDRLVDGKLLRYAYIIYGGMTVRFGRRTPAFASSFLQ